MPLRRTNISMIDGLTSGRIAGRVSGGTGPIEELTGAQARALVFSGTDEATIAAAGEAARRLVDGLPPEAMLAAPWQVERGSTLLTVTSSAKSVMASNGLLTTTSANSAAYSWMMGRRQMVIEPAATNMLLQSSTLNTTWGKTRVTVTSDAAVAPDGTTTADKIVVDTSATTTHYLRQTVTVATGPYTMSIFLKGAEFSTVRIAMGTPFPANTYVSVDLTTGAVLVTGAGATRVSVTSYAAGWWRVALTASASAGGACACDVTMQSGTATSFTGDGTSGVYCWGAQLEVGEVTTSYISTTTAAVTRAADDVQLTSAARTMLIGLGATLVMRGVAPSALAPPILLGGDAVSLAAITSGGALRLSDGTTSLDATVGSGAVSTGFGAAFSRGPGPLRRASLNGGPLASDACDWWASAPTTLRIGGVASGPTGPVRIDEISIWPWVAGAAATPLLARPWN